METRNIKDIVTKPSEAMRAMVDGLLAQSKRKNFKIDMSTYGYRDYNEPETKLVCFGCAATCAVQQIAGKNFTPGQDFIEGKRSRADFLNFYRTELDLFEHAIDKARQCMFDQLFEFFEIETPSKFTFTSLDKLGLDFDLSTKNWKKKLPIVEKIIALLEKEGY